MPMADSEIVAFQFNNHKSTIVWKIAIPRWLTLLRWILQRWNREAPTAPTQRRDRSRSRVDPGNPQPVSPIFVGLYVPFSRAAYPAANVPSGVCYNLSDFDQPCAPAR